MGAGKKVWGYYPTTDTWIPLQVDVDGKVIVDMSAITLDDLADVIGAGALEGDMLYFDATSGTFMVGTRANLANLFAALTILHDIGDVNIPAPANLDFIYWDNTAGKWVNISYANLLASIQGDTSLDELADVNAPAPADNDVLYWNDGASEWQAKAVSPTEFHDLAISAAHDPTANGVWEDWDLSAIIPAGSKGAQIVGIAWNQTIGARKKGSGLDRKFNPGPGVSFLFLTEVDANRKVEIYSSGAADTAFRVIGYWI